MFNLNKNFHLSNNSILGLWIDLKSILNSFIWSNDVSFDLLQISLCNSRWIKLPDNRLPNRFLTLTIVRITNVVFLDPSIEATSRDVNVLISSVLLSIRSFITLLMIKSIDSKVSKITLSAWWEDVISRSVRVSVKYGTGPACLNKTFVTTSIPVLQIPIVAEQLVFVWIRSVVSAVSASAWNVVVACITSWSCTITIASCIFDNIIRPN